MIVINYITVNLENLIIKIIPIITTRMHLLLVFLYVFRYISDGILE